MSPKGFTSLLTIVGLAAQVATSAESDLTDDCVFKAWVRAPDLTPNSIVQGDVRVKAIGQCQPEHIELGLRYKERRFVKKVREGVVLPEQPPRDRNFTRSPNLPASPWELPTHQNPFTPSDAQTEYIQAYSNQTLWNVSEEELVLFDIRSSILYLHDHKFVTHHTRPVN